MELLCFKCDAPAMEARYYWPESTTLRRHLMPNVHVPRYEVGLKLPGDEKEPTLKPLGLDCFVLSWPT